MIQKKKIFQFLRLQEKNISFPRVLLGVFIGEESQQFPLHRDKMEASSSVSLRWGSTVQVSIGQVIVEHVSNWVRSPRSNKNDDATSGDLAATSSIW